MDDRAARLQSAWEQAAALHRQGNLTEAELLYGRILAEDPGHLPTLNMFGILLCQSDRSASAEALFRRAIAMDSTQPNCHNNLGIALTNLQRPGEAVCCFDTAIAQAPDYADAFANRAVARASCGQLQDAITDFRRARTLNPRNARAYYQEGICLLQTGDYARGWPLYEWRKAFAPGLPPDASKPPEWRGDSKLVGRTLFLYAEHGMGDIIQFCRYARLARELGARVVLSVAPALHGLLRTLDPDIMLVSPGTGFHAADFQQSLLSLPLALKTTAASIPAAVPYLAAEPERVRAWRGRIGERGLKIGICWQTGPGFGLGPWSRGRSFPLSALRRLAALPGVRLISLQKGATPQQLESGFAVEQFNDLDHGPDAFLDSAALAMSLDLIITADTAIAHLGGALARPTWLALQSIPDWRWLLHRSDTAWYPTLRLYRQGETGDWESVFDQMYEALQRTLCQQRSDATKL